MNGIEKWKYTASVRFGLLGCRPGVAYVLSPRQLHISILRYR
jgi:hypothetical protein